MINDFKDFCNTDTGTNLLTQADWITDPQRVIGNQPGVARLKLVNKALRQATFITSNFAQYLSNALGQDVLDDGVDANILAQITAALSPAPIAIKNSNYTLQSTDGTILGDASGGTITLTLPAASTVPNKIFRIKRLDLTLTSTVNISGSIFMNGGLVVNPKLFTIDEEYEIQSNGTNYYMLSHHTKMQWTNVGLASSLVSASGGGFSVGTGTIDLDQVWMSRDGQDVLLRYWLHKTLTGTGTTGTGAMLFAFPTGITGDTGLLTGNTVPSTGNNVSSTRLSSLGETWGQFGTTSQWVGTVGLWDASHVALANIYDNNTGSGNTNSTTIGSGFGGWASNNIAGYFLDFRMPVTNWRA